MAVTPSLTGRPAFWIVLAMLAAGAAAFSLRYFAEAFPVAKLELEMDREGALEAARERGNRHGWGPEGFRQAASFADPDPEVRTYVELEAGEEDSLGRLVAEGAYHPYRWTVRHFREGETREVSIRFTPAGHPYGFRLRLPEDEPGRALPSETARDLAEEAAVRDWDVDLHRYELVESSQETRPGGRVDHTFVYLRSGAGVGDADFRLRLGVAGDQLSEVTSFVRVPEAFSLRYEEMRGANTRIALVASLLFLVLFFLVGCGYGVFHLLRIRWLEWRTPLAWGAVVAGVMALASLNQLPLSWMGYDTALPEETFLLQRFLEAGVTLVLGTGLLAVIFMAAEGLSRRAFPHHPQQWRFWTPEMASSGPVVGRTVGGYLVAALEVGFVVAFYLFAMRREGWWTPSEALIQPDLLASYAPWLTAVSIALFSGFWEESLFRAVPIAGAALLGTRFGKRGWWIGGALVLQAVLFAAGHADYPQQPSYARLVELLLPALVWGLIYLRFGLVPVILAHASYNLTLISLPLWVSSAPGIWVDRTAVVVLGLLPLWIVLFQGLRIGFRADLPAWGWNGAWTPPVPPLETGPGQEREGEHLEFPGPAHGGPGSSDSEGTRLPAGAALLPRSRPLPPSLLAGAAVVGTLLLVLGGVRIHADAPPLTVDRHQATALARDALGRRGMLPDGEWQTLTGVRGGRGASHRFVWEEESREAYQALMGSYLAGPGWVIRFARFTGPVEDRAEEYRVELEADGRLRRIQLRLPEEREGRLLEEEEAREQARSILARELGQGPSPVDPDGLLEISAEATHRPNRRDWSFTWSDPRVHPPLEGGDARVRVDLAGAAAADWFQFIHTPEEWDRQERARSGRRDILDGVSGGLLFLILLGGAVAGVVRWARGRFHARSGLAIMAVAGAALLLSGINTLPSTMVGFSTTLRFGEQLVITVAGLSLAAMVLGVGLGLHAGFLHVWAPSPVGGHPRRALVAGGSLGLLAAGGLRILEVSTGADGPLWPSFVGAGGYLPAVGPTLSAVVPFIAYTLFLLLVVVGTERLTGGWRHRRATALALLLLAGLAAPHPGTAGTVGGWLLIGVLMGAGFLLLFRLRPGLPLGAIPWLVATVLALDALRELPFGAFPGAGPGHLLAAAILLGLAWVWGGHLEREGSSARHG
jgi:membrane protease YdiL (CAAX protease family)